MLHQPVLRAEHALLSASLSDAERHLTVERREGIESHRLRVFDVVVDRDLAVSLRGQHSDAVIGRARNLPVNVNNSYHRKGFNRSHLKVDVIVLQGDEFLDSLLGVLNHLRKVVPTGEER